MTLDQPITLRQALDLAEAEGRSRYADGYRDGLQAADIDQAKAYAASMAAEHEAALAERVRGIVAGLQDAPPSGFFQAAGIDPVTATSDEITRATTRRQAEYAERVRNQARGAA